MSICISTCHATLTRPDQARPWHLDLIVAFTPADGVVHYESFQTTSRDDLTGLLGSLGINGVPLAADVPAIDHHGAIRPTSPDEIVAAVAASPGFAEMSLAASGCTGDEMAKRAKEVRAVCV